MRVRLARKGAPSKEARSLIANFNDFLDTASAEDKIKYGHDYSSIEEIRDAYAQATGASPVDIKTSDTIPKDEYFDDAKVVSESFKVSDEIPEEFDFDPNNADVVQRAYNKDVVDPTMSQTVGEPIYSTEPIPASAEQPQASSEQPASSGATPPPNTGTDQPGPGISNPAMNELGDKEKKIAAAQMVDMILGLYENVHQWVKPLARIKEKKIIELEAKGIIDPRDTVQVDMDGTKVTARELVHSTNQSIDEVLTPDPTFNGKVREPMIREFAKRGLGLTDMQYILIMFGQDIATKGAMIMGVRKNMNSILDIYKDQQKERKMFTANQKVTPVEPDSIRTEESNQEPVMETEQVY